jgi:hypothetical protein
LLAGKLFEGILRRKPSAGYKTLVPISMTLQAGDDLAHYEMLAPMSARAGMGEVFGAKNTRI